MHVEFKMCTHAIELAYTKAAELANLEVQECVWGWKGSTAENIAAADASSQT